jgi:hypothetical protein
MTRPSAVECLYIITANGKRLKGMHTCSESPARPLLAGRIRGGTTARYALISNFPTPQESKTLPARTRLCLRGLTVMPAASRLLHSLSWSTKTLPTTKKKKKKQINLSQVARLFLFHKEENLCKTNFARKYRGRW